MNKSWKDGEYAYCCKVAQKHGNREVGRNPKAVASYFRLQAASAFRDGEIEIAARLGHAATLINCDARNDHEPAWDDAAATLNGFMA